MEFGYLKIGYRCPSVPRQEPAGGETVVGKEVRSVATRQLCPKSPRKKLSLIRGERIPDTGAGGRPGESAGSRDHRRQQTASGAFPSEASFSTGLQARACFGRDVTSDFFFRLLAEKRSVAVQLRFSGFLFFVSLSFFLFFCRLYAPRPILPEYYTDRVISVDGSGSPEQRKPQFRPPVTPPAPDRPAHLTRLRAAGLREYLERALVRHFRATLGSLCVSPAP